MKKTIIPLGNTVICDMCNRNYTKSDETGGVQFGSYACCPKCSSGIISSAKEYNEERYLTYPNEGETFRDFVMRLRGGNNDIIITTF